MTFTLFEWLKEAKEELLEEQPLEAPVSRIAEINADVSQMTLNDDQGEVMFENIYIFFSSNALNWLETS